MAIDSGDFSRKMLGMTGPILVACRICGDGTSARNELCRPCLRKWKAAGFGPLAELGCEFPGCTRPLHSAGLCSGHYSQQYAGNELRPISSEGPREKAERNAKVLQVAGEKGVGEAARQFGISRSRVYAICKKSRGQS